MNEVRSSGNGEWGIGNKLQMYLTSTRIAMDSPVSALLKFYVPY